MNMVRDPVSRAVSNFYFVRNPRRWQGREVILRVTHIVVCNFHVTVIWIMTITMVISVVDYSTEVNTY